jgi:serine/threonine-protein kinase RsbW
MSAMDQQVVQQGTALIELVLTAVPASVGMARSVLHAASNRAGFRTADYHELAVAVSEAMTNAVVHAGAGLLTVRYQVAEDEVVAEVEDDGTGFDTAVIERPYAPGHQSGRGMLLMRSLVDALQCTSGPGGTIVRLVKRRPDVPSTVVPWPGASRPRRAIGHLKQTIHRYQRDVQLMIGSLSPSPENVDDLTIMEAFAAARDKDSLISDRKLRIKTLEATLEILQEELD